MTPRLTSTISGTVALGVVLNVLEQPPQGFLLLGGQLSEHRDQHCAVAACPMQKGSEMSDHGVSSWPHGSTGKGVHLLTGTEAGFNDYHLFFGNPVNLGLGFRK